MTLWEIDIYPADGQPDSLAKSVLGEAHDLGIASKLQVWGSHGYLIESDFDARMAERVATSLLADPIAETTIVARVGQPTLAAPPAHVVDSAPDAEVTLVHVLPKPGVTDPVAESTLKALANIDVTATGVRTFRKFWIAGVDSNELQWLCKKILSNDSIEQVIVGPLQMERLSIGSPYELKIIRVPISSLSETELMKLSRENQLYLSLAEMQTIQAHFQSLGREPTDIELETLAQTWSEHCSHKTLAGRIAYTDENGTRHFANMLKETIFAATTEIRKQLGESDWCVSVFKDNAGVVRFDDNYHVVFKVETHNHPSAIEPYGGANTGLGGVIRDPLGTGLGAKPVCNTDVFCFARPDTPADQVPPGALHPRRVLKGVVSGVRDYGNRMGIPTVNGAVYFDDRYLGNPLVYCGNVGIIPVDKAEKQPQPGDYIVAIGGRTGRDGIHGATFSSVELTHESESISGGSVQIGNAITEKMVLDVLLQARDEGLYTAVTDCGAGGFSSAAGEMGEDIGAEVWLDRAPLKYEGLSYTEIWISEAQERMVLSVPPNKWERLSQLCAFEGVEASIIGQFVPGGQLRLIYRDEEVGLLSMEFLHRGRPPVIRHATYAPVHETPLELGPLSSSQVEQTVLDILSSPNVASKHWIIRQYDHEVQGGSVIKPLVGPACDGPSDAAVVRPRLDSQRGLVVSCGMNPRYGDCDPYHMAASAIDEAIRNAVAVGANPDRIAILDNFCWGNTERPETLGSLVRAALACHDLALAWKTPFISGKDSLNNEFTWTDERGTKQTVAIPASLLISALGQVDDVRHCVTMDFKQPGNAIYLIGATRDELGGSHAAMVLNRKGGHVPRVDASLAIRLFKTLHQAIQQRLVRACHDLSEGGLAIALAEMSFAGQWGATIDIDSLCHSHFVDPPVALFSESNSRFLCEVPESKVIQFECLFRELPCCRLGTVSPTEQVIIRSHDRLWMDLSWRTMKEAWLKTLDFA